jgi:hypothetical protein
MAAWLYGFMHGAGQVHLACRVHSGGKRQSGGGSRGVVISRLIGRFAGEEEDGPRRLPGSAAPAAEGAGPSFTSHAIIAREVARIKKQSQQSQGARRRSCCHLIGWRPAAGMYRPPIGPPAAAPPGGDTKAM